MAARTLLPLLALLGCGGPAEAPRFPALDTAGPETCPAPGQALARQLQDGESLPGETAVGTAGDWILSNGLASFVITEPDKGTTYYHYGGIVADAVAMDGCAYASEDKLDEVGLVFAEVDLSSFASSEVRAFRGESVELVADGTDGGPAIVRVHGVDDHHWLVEYELVVAALGDGGKALSEPYGVDVAVDYILDPDSPVLEMQVHVTNTGSELVELVLAGLLSFGPSLDLHGYAPNVVSAAGLDLDFGMPWLVATDGTDALAYGVEAGNLAYVGISGVEVAVDINQALTAPLAAAPGGTASRSVYLSVASGGGVSATGPLADANPEPLLNQTLTLEPVTGRVVGPDGAGIAGARVEIQAQAPGAGWGTLDEATSGPDGSISAQVPVVGSGWAFRLVARTDGRDDSLPVPFSPGDTGVVVPMEGRGSLAVRATDGEGTAAPVRLHLVRQEDGRTEHRWVAGEGTRPLSPGTWDWTATRGYEFAPQRGTVTVPEDGEAALSVSLDRVLDTTGWVSVDTHVHSSDSPDSRVTPEGVVLRAAGHGLDLVVHTEHEHIVDRSGVAAAVGVDAWTRSIIGEEVTATVPEHLTMFPAEPEGPRGGPVEWYGRDLDELFGLMRERSGGGVNLLNHPSYLDLISWDDVLAEPRMDDPTLLGLAPDAALWSWDLDGIEVMNGHSSPFDRGRWGHWQSMLNAGHPLVAVGCSDSHSGDDIGFPRTYVPAGSDRPADVTDAEVVEAFQGGQAQASTGAFARVRVDGTAGLGDLLTTDAETVALDLHLEALPEVDVTFVSVFVNCDEVLTVATDDPSGVVKLSRVLAVPLPDGEDAALTVAAFGEQRLPLGLPQFNPNRVPRVLTSAVYVDRDGDGAFSGGGGRECAVFLEGPEG